MPKLSGVEIHKNQYGNTSAVSWILDGTTYTAFLRQQCRYSDTCEEPLINYPAAVVNNTFPPVDVTVEGVAGFEGTMTLHHAETGATILEVGTEWEDMGHDHHGSFVAEFYPEALK